MRTALLSATDRTQTGDLRAGLALGGRSVLAWQAGFARALGCERIICLCESPGDAVLDLQRDFEGQGGEFHAIRNNLQLLSLVRAEDELVMMRDGLVIDLSLSDDWRGAGGKLQAGIATVAASHIMVEAQGSDFERIDRERHWAGLAVFKAAQVHKLADFPPDGDAMSLLLRLALQARVECRNLGPDSLENGRWLIAAAGRDMIERERDLIQGHATKAHWSGIGSAISAAIVRKVAPKGLENGAEISLGAAGLLMGAGCALAAYGHGAAALGVGTGGFLAFALGQSFAQMRQALWSKTRARWQGLAQFYSGEVLAVTLLLYVSWLAGSSVTGLALPVLVIGISHYLGFRRSNAISAFWRDRVTHFAGFTAAAASGFLEEAVALFALAGLAGLLIQPRHAQNGS